MAKTTKQELIAAIVKASKCSKKCAADSLNAVLEEIKSSLSKGKDVAVAGLGTFKVKQRKARTGRNPKTGATIKIPARKVPAFKAGKELKEAVK